MNENNAAQELPDFNSPEVQAVYETLCGTAWPPAGEHWEGWVSRHIVLALRKLRAPVADELPGDTRWPVLRAMARNYTAGKHTWDALDAEACEQAAEEIRHLRAALASAPVAGEALASMVNAKPLEPEFAKVLADNFDSLVLRSDAAPQASASVRIGRATTKSGRVQSYAFEQTGLPDGEHALTVGAPQASEAVRDAEDAARWRWATASDGNADKLCSIVLCHGGYQDKINERADFYRAALSAQSGAQKGEAHEA